MQQDFFIGIDVSKKQLHIGLLPANKTRVVANTPEGIEDLVRRCVKWEPELVVLESTGGLERPAG